MIRNYISSIRFLDSISDFNNNNNLLFMLPINKRPLIILLMEYPRVDVIIIIFFPLLA